MAPSPPPRSGAPASCGSRVGQAVRYRAYLFGQLDRFHDRNVGAVPGNSLRGIGDCHQQIQLPIIRRGRFDFFRNGIHARVGYSAVSPFSMIVPLLFKRSDIN